MSFVSIVSLIFPLGFVAGAFLFWNKTRDRAALGLLISAGLLLLVDIYRTYLLFGLGNTPADPGSLPPAIAALPYLTLISLPLNLLQVICFIVFSVRLKRYLIA